MAFRRDCYLLILRQRAGISLFWDGSLSGEAGPIARLKSPTGAKLKIAAKIDKVDQEYWTNVIEPMVASSPNVRVHRRNRGEGQSGVPRECRCPAFPHRLAEPFGLVMIEAMSCGTPVIVFRRGSAAEVIDDGMSGYLVEDVGQAIAAVRRIPELDRARVKQRLLCVASILHA